MKKKYALALAAAAMVGTLAVGGTLAWFTAVSYTHLTLPTICSV